MKAAFEACIAGGGVAVFPADTVYGLGVRPARTPAAVERLYALKGRAPDKPAAVMFFDRDRALAALPELGPRTRALLERLLPGAVTLLLPSDRFPLAGGAGTLGLRVPDLPALAGLARPVLQTSANLPGGPDAAADRGRAGADPARRRAGLRAGELPGTPSTVVDLRDYEGTGAWSIVRARGGA